MKRANRSPLWRRSVASEVDDELETHLELRRLEFEAAGLSPEEARRKALERFGDVERHAAECRREAENRNRRWRWSAWLDEWRQDLRFAVRQLGRRPALASLLIGMLALGIGATTALSGMWHAAFWKPLPYGEPDRLVTVWEERVASGKGLNVVGPANFYAFRRSAETLDAMAGFITVPASINVLGDADQPSFRAGIRWVTDGYFDILRVPPTVGRIFTPEVALAGQTEDAGSVVILSHHLWQERFGGRMGVLGESIEIDGAAYEIVGVMPPEVALDLGPARAPYGNAADLWSPMAVPEEWATRRGRFLMVVARLNDGLGVADTQAEIAGLMKRQAEALPNINDGWIGHAIALREILDQPVDLPLTLLGGAVLVLLSIVCINASSLLLSRNLARGDELKVRRALGAGRGRLLRQLLAEGALVALLSSGAGWLVALALRRLAVTTLPAHLADSAATPALWVWTTSAALAAAVVLLMTWLPGLPTLRGLGRLRRNRAVGGGRERRRMRAGLVFAQTALALVLLVGAALMFQTVRGLLDVDPGFDIDGVVTFSVSPSRSYDPVRASAFYDNLMERVGALPGVENVGAVTYVPMAGLGSGTSFAATDRPEPEPGDRPVADIRVVRRDYFRAFGIDLLRGREFDASDHADQDVGSLVVSRELAESLWPAQDPVGRNLQVNWGDTERERVIVGVVEDVHHADPATAARPAIYFPHAQEPERQMSLVVESTRDLESLAPDFRRLVSEIDPTIPIYDVRAVREILRGTLADQQFLSRIITAFAAVAFLLSVLGIYGVTSISVAESRQEVGLRMALGARPTEVIALFVQRVAIWTSAALVSGLAAAVLAARAAQSLFFGVEAFEPPVLAAVALLVALSALVATVIPARRAAKVDPSRTLRSE